MLGSTTASFEVGVAWQQTSRLPEIDLDGRLEPLQELEAVVAQLVARPAADLEYPLGVLGVHRLGLGAEVERKHELVRVPEDAGAVELPQELDALDRLRAALGDVPERDDQIRLDTLDVRERRAKGDGVAVHVGEESDAHAADTTGTP